jgi:hypothetical protein
LVIRATRRDDYRADPEHRYGRRKALPRESGGGRGACFAVCPAPTRRRSPARARAHAHAMPLLAVTSLLRAIADGLNRDKVPTGQGDSKWYAATMRGVLARLA